MIKKSIINKLSYLLMASCIAAISFNVYAEEAYILATVSKILETESEDCVYFVAKSDFGSEGKQSKQFDICIFDGPDVQTKVSRVVDAYEQKNALYILAEGSSVKRIEIIDDTLSVRNGVFAVVGESGNQTLLFDSEVLRDQKDYLLSFVDQFAIDDSDVVLMMNVLGGTACPAQYFFVSASPQGNVTLSQEFGTCSDLAKAHQKRETIEVTMPGNEGTATYEYKNGRVVDAGNRGERAAANTLLVDGKTIVFEARDVNGNDAAVFQMESNGYQNTYLLDCENQRFLWISNIYLRAGEETGNSNGAEWRDMNQRSSIANAVYQAVCPR
jgi:hypothetical protein